MLYLLLAQINLPNCLKNQDYNLIYFATSMDEIQLSPLARVIFEQYTRIYQKFNQAFQTQAKHQIKVANEGQQNQLQPIIDQMIQDYERNIDVMSPENNLSLIQEYEKRGGNTEQFKVLKCRLETQIKNKQKNALSIKKEQKAKDQNQSSKSEKLYLRQSLASAKENNASKNESTIFNGQQQKKGLTIIQSHLSKRVPLQNEIVLCQKQSQLCQKQLQNNKIQQSKLLNVSKQQKNEQLQIKTNKNQESLQQKNETVQMKQKQQNNHKNNQIKDGMSKCQNENEETQKDSNKKQKEEKNELTSKVFAQDLTIGDI